MKPDIYLEIEALKLSVTHLAARVTELEESQVHRNDQWYTRKEAALRLRCHPSTIDEMAASGRLPRHYLGSKPLFLHSDLMSLLSRTTSD